MTPAQAIKQECKVCKGLHRGILCDSNICKLSDKTLSPLKRIKAHCLDCAGVLSEAKNCNGKLIFEDRLCYLHPYRLGRNPRAKGNSNTSHLDKFRFKKKVTPQSHGLEV